MIRINVDDTIQSSMPAQETKRTMFLRLKEMEEIDKDAKINDFTFRELKDKLSEVNDSYSQG